MVMVFSHLQVINHDDLLLVRLMLLMLMLMRGGKLGYVKVRRLDALSSNLIERTHSHVAYPLVVLVLMGVLFNAVDLALALADRLAEYP